MSGKFLAALATMIATLGPAVACEPSDFTIKEAYFQYRHRPGIVKVIGEITNNCNEAAGAELRLVFIDVDGEVTGVFEGWPANTDNIPAQSNYAFTWVVKAGDDAATMQATITHTEKWK
jgi:hypothetical protein